MSALKSRSKMCAESFALLQAASFSRRGSDGGYDRFRFR